MAIAHVLAFMQTKLTTGEGGMAIFKRKSDAEKAKILRDHGMSRKKNIGMIMQVLILE